MRARQKKQNSASFKDSKIHAIVSFAKSQWEIDFKKCQCRDRVCDRGRGFHWGMATPSPVLPRGTRINVGNTGSIERILRGPAKLDDGTHNLLGCLKTSMGTLGAQTIKEMQQVEVVVAPSLLTEGKVYQKAQHLGMGK